MHTSSTYYTYNIIIYELKCFVLHAGVKDNSGWAVVMDTAALVRQFHLIYCIFHYMNYSVILISSGIVIV